MDFCPYRANIVCILTQGVALGYGLLPLQGVLESSILASDPCRAYHHF